MNIRLPPKPGEIYSRRAEYDQNTKSMVSEKLDEVDEAILAIFHDVSREGPMALPPKVVWYNLVEQRGLVQKSSDTIVRRMQMLNEYRLLERVDSARGYYKLSEQGEDYVTGETSLAEILGPKETIETGPFSDLEWDLLRTIDDSSPGREVDDCLFEEEDISRGLNRLLNFGFVREENGRYTTTDRGRSARELKEVYERFGPEEFFSQLTEREADEV